jgi:peroxiredoxin (alkyl hydroperoxide reductase subunit C)
MAVQVGQPAPDFALTGVADGDFIDVKLSDYRGKAWIERDFGSLPFPLLSDIRREATDAYGVLLPDGIALRGTFIVDPEGTLKYAVVHDNNIGRNTDETLRVLQALQTGELCPLDWRPGEATLS